jgi:hypothetical protein
MRIYGFWLLLFTCLYASLRAQSLSPSVISPDGGVDRNSVIQLEWTLGEPAIQNKNTGERMYTEGYHQPIVRVEEITLTSPHQITAGNAFIEKNDEIQIHPNPVTSVLNVTFAFRETKSIQLHLLRYDGSILQSKMIETGTGNLEINMTDLPEGLYLVQFMSADGLFQRAFKIIKIQ